MTGYPNVTTNIVLLGTAYFSSDLTPQNRGQILFHGFLHIFYQQGDSQLAGTLGLGEGLDTGAASLQIRKFIEKGCKD